MAANLTMVRIATKLDDLFNEKIDISDVKTSDDDRSTFYSRAIAALSIMIQCGIDETLSGSCVTDGYHDMGIDAVYNDSTYQRYGNRLFAKNIRYYKGSTDVNQGIKEVLRTEPEKFFYYNNGVKLLCRKITRKAAHSTDRITGLFALEGVSLVNGAQTTGSIGAVYADMPDVVARAKVFIQMIDLADTEEEQATQITRFTNTQNRIDGKDFAALDPEQERIKNELSFSGIQYANYLTAFFDAKSLPELVNPLCQKYWELTFSAMEEKYPDAYPAHIFKNIGRLREIKEQICLRDSKSQEE